jgi:hypothetical protein
LSWVYVSDWIIKRNNIAILQGAGSLRFRDRVEALRCDAVDEAIKGECRLLLCAENEGSDTLKIICGHASIDENPVGGINMVDGGWVEKSIERQGIRGTSTGLDRAYLNALGKYKSAVRNILDLPQPGNAQRCSVHG